MVVYVMFLFFFFQAEDGIRDTSVTGVQTCALPISGGQPAGRPVGDDDLSDLEPGGWGDHGADDGGLGVCAVGGQGGGQARQQGGADGDGSGEEEVLTGIHEPAGQSSGV